MKRKAWIALLLAAALAYTGAHAEIASEQTAFAADAEALTGEEVGLTVDDMFAAAAGTTQAAEQSARKSMTEPEQAERNAENALYRAKTLPWLTEALKPEEAQTESGEAEENAINPQNGGAACVPVYTYADSYEAMLENEPGRAYLARLEALGGTDAESCMAIARLICQSWMAQIAHETMRETNGDYAGWIYGSGTQIDYPVVRGADNSHYLNHLFNGARNASGTLFIDYRNLPDFQDPNTLIYGHHMRNGSMFGELTHYEEQAYYESHPYLLIMTPKEIALVELFAGYTTSQKDHCYDIAISDEDDMRVFMKTAREKSDFDSAVEPETADRLVTLSTCAYAFDNARYIAIGRLVTVWEQPGERRALGDLPQSTSAPK